MDIDPMEVRKVQFGRAPLKLAYDKKEGSLQAWKEAAGHKLEELLGLNSDASFPFEKPEDARFTIDWTVERKGIGGRPFKETRFYFQSEPGLWVLAHLVVPGAPGLEQNEKLPLVICLQGHGTGMHFSLGRNVEGAEDESLVNSDHAYALQCAARGMAALAIEMRGFGESGSDAEQRANCRLQAGSALLIGRTAAGERVWDIMRAIDMLETHFPEIDRQRIGIMGCSGGGSAAFYTMILEKRIAAALLDCCFSSYVDSIGLISHCNCNHIPHIMEYFDMGDLAGLFAPKPLVIVNGNRDPIFPLEAAKKQFKRTETIYRDAGATDRCCFISANGGHGFYPAQAWGAFCPLSTWGKDI